MLEVLLNIFFSSHCLFVLAFLFISASHQERFNLSFVDILKGSYLFVSLSLAVPFFWLSAKGENPFGLNIRPNDAIELYLNQLPQATDLKDVTGGVDVGLIFESFDDLKSLVAGILVFAMSIALILYFLNILRAVLQQVALLKTYINYKTLGRVTILLSDQVQNPYSFWFGRSYIVIPLAMLSHPLHFKIALAHEIQHHRQGDTRWVYIMESLKVLFFMNPFYWKLKNKIYETQELACDEVLIGQKGIHPQDYGQCLLYIARLNNAQPNLPFCALGMSVQADHLKGRIKNMFNQRTRLSRQLKLSTLILAFLSFSLVAHYAQAFAEGKSVTMVEAKAMADKLNKELDVPIVVDKKVLYWLNKSIATKGAREYFRGSMDRLEEHKAMIEGKLKGASLPTELMAVPIIESGYRNDLTSTKKAAGIWQFIPESARRCGLRVNAQVDERLKPGRLTDAAVCYYQKLFAIFNDWHLAIMAYNVGEHRVEEIIKKQGHSDALALAREGSFGKEGGNYLPKVIASMIVMNNPELLN